MPLAHALQLGNWHLGPNDNDLLGWATTLAYFASAVACFLAARAEPAPPRRLFWTGTAAFLFLLGLNKQLDLQLLAYEILRRAIPDVIRAHRTLLRHLLAVTFFTTLLAAAGLIAYRLRRALTHLIFPATLLALLLTFIFIRTGTVRRIDVNPSHTIAVHVALELLPVVLLGLVAWRRRVTSAIATTTPASAAHTAAASDPPAPPRVPAPAAEPRPR
jgi:hypothetical protein